MPHRPKPSREVRPDHAPVAVSRRSLCQRQADDGLPGAEQVEFRQSPGSGLPLSSRLVSSRRVHERDELVPLVSQEHLHLQWGIVVPEAVARLDERAQVGNVHSGWQLVLASGELQVLRRAVVDERGIQKRLRRVGGPIVPERGTRCVFRLTGHRSRHPETLSKLRHVPVHQSRTEPLHARAAPRPRPLLDEHGPHVLGDAAVRAEQSHDLVVRWPVFQRPPALRFVDRLAVRVERSTSLGGNVACRAVGVTEADHRRQRKGRRGQPQDHRRAQGEPGGQLARLIGSLPRARSPPAWR